MKLRQIVSRLHQRDQKRTFSRVRNNRTRRRYERVPFFQQLECRHLLATFVVDSTLDTLDADLGDDVAEDSAGNTTLRAAIMQANATAGPDTITLPAGNYQLTIAGRLDDLAETGDLDITDDLDIVGAGASTTTIDAAGIDRVFHIFPAGVNISGVTIRGGLATDDTFVEGIAQGGGLYILVGTVAISNSIITANQAVGRDGFEGMGGGIFSSVSSMTLNNTVIQNNQALGSNALLEVLAADGQGGGIFSDGGTWFLVSGTTIANNQAIGGSAIASNLEIPGGRGMGGGIYSQFSTWQSVVPGLPGLVASTISGNEARGGEGRQGRLGGEALGGGIHIDTGTWSILNTTISTNAAVGGRGGAGNGGTGGPGGNAFGGGVSVVNGVTANVSYVTIAANRATGGSGGTGATNGAAGTGQGGGLFQNGSTINSLSTIYATNSASTMHPDYSGPVATKGHNLVGDGTGSSSFSAAMFDQVGTSSSPINPLLGPLQGNGGPTSTHALLFGSPAIDNADSTNFPATDQRGVSRPTDGDGNAVAVPDIGAFEAPEMPPARIQIDKFVKKIIVTPPSDQDLCDTIGKPKEVTFRYTGGGPSATNTHQPPGKFSVTGDPRSASPVFIRTTNSATASSTSTVFFSGTVLLDATFTAKVSNAGATRFPSNIFIHIFDPGMNLLQTVQYHTSCSAPIVLGDVIGGVTLTGVVGETGSASLPPPLPPGDFGDDADTPTGPTINIGESVRFTYAVTNPGFVPLANIVVRDDNETPGNPFDDFQPDPIVVTEGMTQFNVGDADRDNRLDPGEQWLYAATAKVTNSGQHKNIGHATGTNMNRTVTASDPAHFITPMVCVDIRMEGYSSTSGKAGNIVTFSADGISVKASGFSREKASNTWAPAYLGAYGGGLGVTDTSEGSGSNNSHTVDNIGRNNYVLFEFSKPVVIDQAFLGYIVDDSDITVWIGNFPDPFSNHLILNDAVLSSFGFMEFNHAATFTTTRWADINNGNLTGNALVIAGATDDTNPEDQFKIKKLTACDASRLPKAAIDIEKATNGTDADSTPGPKLLVGSTATFTYKVSNFGSVPLNSVVVRDDNATPDITTDDFSPAPVLSGGSNVGDTNKDNRLDLTEVWQYTASRKVTAGQYTNIGRVVAQSSDRRTVRDSDASNHFGFVNGPAIDIEKFVRGGTSQQQVGVNLCIDHGKPVSLTFAYTGGGPDATNTHQPPGKYVVTGNPNGAATVFIRVSNSSSASSSGQVYFFEQVNLNSEFTVVAADGGQSGFSSNTFFHLFADAAATTLLQTVQYHTSCSAPIVLGDVTGGITLTGFIGEDAQSISIPPPNNIDDPGMDADKPNGPSINVGQQVVWTYRVVNTGNQPLKEVVVTDDRGTPASTSDDFKPPALLSSGFNIGDVNKNNLIDPAETWLYRAVDKVITDGLYVNIGKVTAKTVAGATTVTDKDPAYYLGVLQAINASQANEYPHVLVMRYTGDNVISNSQSPGKVSVTGNLNGATPVRIKATNSSDPKSSYAKVYFDGQVSVGQNFGIDADKAGQNRLDSTTYVHIFDLAGKLLRTIRFDTSKSQPLVLKDRFGGIMLVGFLGEKGTAFGIQLPAASVTDLTKKVTVSGKQILVDLTNVSTSRVATIQGLMVDWASSSKKLKSIKIDGKDIVDKSKLTAPATITSFDGDLGLRRFGPGAKIRLTFEFESNASLSGFKLSVDLGNGLTPLIP